MEWKIYNRFGTLDYVLEGDGFRIYYTEKSRLFKELFSDSVKETSLFKDGKYYILNGDFRKEYENLVPQGYDACKAFFDSRPNQKSTWSY